MKEKFKLLEGNNLELLKTLEENSIDSIVTDPPYGLSFMGKKWDYNVPSVEFWKEVYRVLKPGGHVLSFGGTRTYHRMVVNIEDAGFEIRDQIMWVYGSGFPKSLNIGKAVDKLQGNEREVNNAEGYRVTTNSMNNGLKNKCLKCDKPFFSGNPCICPKPKGTSEWEGWGTALKPSVEPICMARKPLAEKTVAENVLKYGTGGINIDESRVVMSDEDIKTNTAKASKEFTGVKPFGEEEGKGSALLPNTQGRFPANLIHDNSEEVRECFPDTKSNDAGEMIYRRTKSNSINSKGMNEIGKGVKRKGYKDNGNSSRYFKSIIYQPKASKKDRGEGNNHPTVKPINLMTYLCRLITPKGGIVLDPFNGSGSTGVAALLEGFNYIGMEMDSEYISISEARINNYENYRKSLI
jgi:DNA modification methylase